MSAYLKDTYYYRCKTNSNDTTPMFLMEMTVHFKRGKNRAKFDLITFGY